MFVCLTSHEKANDAHGESYDHDDRQLENRKKEETRITIITSGSEKEKALVCFFDIFLQSRTSSPLGPAAGWSSQLHLQRSSPGTDRWSPAGETHQMNGSF